MKMVPDDVASVAYLTQLYWPEGFICPALLNKFRSPSNKQSGSSNNEEAVAV